MLRYIVKRLLLMIPTLAVISMISFAVITLPPGDYLDTLIQQMEEKGDPVSLELVDAMRERYALDKPVYVQYLRWVGGILHGDFGYSMQYRRPVSELIWSRIGLTACVSLGSILLTWLLAFPTGVYCAVRQRSFGDYVATFLGFVGMATPNFLIALVFMYVAFEAWGFALTGLFSREFINAPWSAARVVDLLKHIWLPIAIVGTAGTAGMIRVLRNNLLDYLSKPYVVTARAKGVGEAKLLFKYPVRMALNPFVSGIGGLLPALISADAITGIVLNLPTTGPMMLGALRGQDLYLAASFLFLLTTLGLVGRLISDLLLTVLDPRIKYE